ncbi:MAG: sulfate ABC transporter permease subunit CysT [Planctomyces sp.]|nr:sulfate ABC transporter permease subunit CysT [Planctomyces sp.]
MTPRKRRVLPGFGLSLSYTMLILLVLLFIPLVVLVYRATSLGPEKFLQAVWTPQARAAYGLTFGASLAAAAIDTVLGLLIAWVLVRYEFPLKRVFDALVDLPFALPTAVAGLVYSALYVESGWLGRYLVPLGFHGAHSRTAIVLVLTFIGLPFVVRAVQPVLESLDADVEEAAASLGANRWQVLSRVLFPALQPALLTGFALTFARGLGEFGSVVFVSGNMPYYTEIAPVLIVAKLEAFAYAEATAIALVLLICSFGMLAVINTLERRSRRHEA